MCSVISRKFTIKIDISRRFSVISKSWTRQNLFSIALYVYFNFTMCSDSRYVYFTNWNIETKGYNGWIFAFLWWYLRTGSKSKAKIRRHANRADTINANVKEGKKLVLKRNDEIYTLVSTLTNANEEYVIKRRRGCDKYGQTGWRSLIGTGELKLFQKDVLALQHGLLGS